MAEKVKEVKVTAREIVRAELVKMLTENGTNLVGRTKEGLILEVNGETVAVKVILKKDKVEKGAFVERFDTVTAGQFQHCKTLAEVEKIPSVFVMCGNVKFWKKWKNLGNDSSHGNFYKGWKILLRDSLEFTWNKMEMASIS